MADEINVRGALKVYKTGADDVVMKDWNFGANFNADMAGNTGPTPGSIVATTGGTDVDLSQLVTPGFVYIKNDDDTNYVSVGVNDPEQDRFYPLMELLPGEGYVFRLSRIFGQEYYPATGTGTTGPTNTLRVRADTASCAVFVGAFER